MIIEAYGLWKESQRFIQRPSQLCFVHIHAKRVRPGRGKPSVCAGQGLHGDMRKDI